MAVLNEVTQELLLKVVYVGCCGSGKTTSIQSVYKQTSADVSSRFFDLHQVAQNSPLFDFLPLSLGESRSQPLRLHLYTMPDLGYWPTLNKQILQKVDGLIWVVDSRAHFLERNELYLAQLCENLASVRKSFDEVPLVIQFNHRDHAKALPVKALRSSFSRKNSYFAESVAVQDIGVLESVESMIEALLQSMEISSSLDLVPAKFSRTRRLPRETQNPQA